MKKLILHEFLDHFRSYWTTSGHGGWRPVYAKELAWLPLSNVLSLYRFECVIRPQVVGILVHKVKKRSQKGGSWWYLQLANMLSLGCDQVVFQLRYPARRPKNDSLLIKKAHFCVKKHKKVSFPVPGGVGGENHTCHQIDPNMSDKTSGGWGFAKSTASCSKLVFSQFWGVKLEGGTLLSRWGVIRMQPKFSTSCILRI